MKKILFIIAFMFSATGIVQAASIDGETDGVSKHNVIGFGVNDVFVANSNTTATTVSLTDNGTAVADDGFPSSNTDGLADGFIHDFIFTAVQDTFVAITASLQLAGGVTISPLAMEVWHIVMGADVLLASATLDSGTFNASETVSLTMGETYVVRMSNCSSNDAPGDACSAPGTIGTAADYTLNVLTPVPVPAAVWLFGTALLGLFGYKRKAQAAVAA